MVVREVCIHGLTGHGGVFRVYDVADGLPEVRGGKVEQVPGGRREETTDEPLLLIPLPGGPGDVLIPVLLGGFVI